MKRMPTHSFSLTPELLAAIAETAKKRDESMSRLARRAFEAEIRRCKVEEREQEEQPA